MVTVSTAQTPPDIVKVKVGKSVKNKKSKVTVKLLEVIEDSRCPEGVNCIWAGNAKVRLELSGLRGTKVIEANTNMGPQGDRYEAYSITLRSLTPHPKNGVTTDKSSYIAEVKIERLSR